MEQLPPLLALLAIFLLLLALMLLGWRLRSRRQVAGGLPAPLPVPTDPERTVDDAGSAAGVYVSTTPAEHHLERITAHGLGHRSRVLVTPGRAADGSLEWQIRREGAPSFLIPGDQLQGTTTAPGMVGKWMGGESLLVLRWRLGDRILDTGLRLDSRADHDRLLSLAPISRKETP